VLSGGVAFNLLLAFACYFGEFAGGRGLPKPVFASGAVISQMPSKDSPSFGLLREGDVIVGINDMITSSANYKSGIWESQKEMSDIISVIRETPDGESVRLTIVHGRGSDNKEEISVNPKKNSDGLMSIGVTLMPNYVRTDVIFASSVADAISKAGSAVYDLTSETAQSIVGLLIGVLLGKGLPAGTSMSGPLGVIKTGTKVVRSSDFAALVSFAASISINLAVVNSLPLPALDGGQLAFVLVEAAAGRRIDQRVQEGINAGALLILLFISFGAAVGDVASIFN
jgi:RIP metalloprotease RseP